MSGGPLDDYGPGDIEYLLAHDNTVLCQIEEFTHGITVPKAPTGSGLGCLKNVRHKRTGAPEGTWSMSRAMLKATEKGKLFLDLLRGAGVIITEAIASAATSHTPGQSLTSILEIRLLTSETQLSENDDYTVNWSTGVITFTTALTEDAEIKYVTTDSDWLGINLIQNTGIEDDITNIWSAVATATVTRAAAAKYTGTYGLNVAIAAQNDGAQYDPNIPVVPGRTYRLTCWLENAGADTVTANWTDAGGSTAMTAVGTAGTMAATYKLHEWTFTPDEATILTITIINTDAAGVDFYLDEIYLRENDPQLDLMDAGKLYGFQFQVLARRVIDGVIVARFEGCEVYSDERSSGDPTYMEALEGQFLGLKILNV